MAKCKTCGKELKKEGRTECYGCRCAAKFAKNGVNTRDTRANRAIKHLNNSKEGLLNKIFGLS